MATGTNDSAGSSIELLPTLADSVGKWYVVPFVGSGRKPVEPAVTISMEVKVRGPIVDVRVSVVVLLPLAEAVAVLR